MIRPAWLLLFSFVACTQAPSLPEQRRPTPMRSAAPPASGSGLGGVRLQTIPTANGDQIMPVVRLVVTAPAATSLDPATVALVRGALSEVSLRRLAEGDPPAVLAGRTVAVRSWRMDPPDNGIVVAPTAVLTPGTYALAIPSAPWKGVVRVMATEAPPVLQRQWPWPTDSATAEVAVLCGERPLAPGWSVLPAPGERPVRIEGGVLGEMGDGSCVTVRAPGNQEALLPPPALLAAEGTDVIALLDPTPLSKAKAAPVSPETRPCIAPAQEFGPTCLEVHDDRLVVHPAPAPLFGLLTVNGETTRHPSSSGTAFVVRGLLPASDIDVRAWFVDTAGRRAAAHGSFTTLPPRSHVIINEVLADARGVEPASEWVELFNDGLADAELSGWRLVDGGGGEVTLPPAILPAGTYALLVANGYMPGSSGDAAPPSTTPVVVVAQLGKAGLSNGGETLTLYNAQGSIMSRFPAVASSKAGVSVVRARPETPDEDPKGFRAAPEGKATPGAPNHGGNGKEDLRASAKVNYSPVFAMKSVHETTKPPLEADDLTAVVGTNLRRLRVQRGLSLERLSRQSGVSRAMLGQVELGQSAPTINILWKIARALDVPFSALTSFQQASNVSVLRGAEAKILASADHAFVSRALFPFDRQRTVEFYELRLASHAVEKADAHPPGTVENLVVSQGNVEVVVEAVSYTLAPSDAILFEADVPHVYRNLGRSEAVLYLVMTYAEKVGLGLVRVEFVLV